MRLLPITRTEPSNSLTTLFDDFVNSFFDDDFNENCRIMPMDVIEEDDKYVVKTNLPGIPKDKVNISVEEKKLIIEAENTEEKEKEEDTYHARERYCGKYQRIVNLPNHCDGDNIKANMTDGVLTLEIPKIEPKPKKKIKVE